MKNEGMTAILMKEIETLPEASVAEVLDYVLFVQTRKSSMESWEPKGKPVLGAFPGLCLKIAREDEDDARAVPLTVAMIQDALAPVFQRNGVRKAVLFGSHAKGTASTLSDVDLMVDSGLKGLDFAGLLDEIYEALHRRLDVVDVAHIEKGSRIDNEIRETGVVIYG